MARESRAQSANCPEISLQGSPKRCGAGYQAGSVIMQRRPWLLIPRFAALFILFHGWPVWAGRAERVNFLGVDFVVYWVDFQSDNLTLHWRDAGGKPLGTFGRLRRELSGTDLKFAINAGIFSHNQEPLGLHIEASRVLQNLNLGDREGGQVNFYMKPNGVFYVADQVPGVAEAAAYAQLGLHPTLACQSGPLLVSGGKLHPKFKPGSTNLHWRSGVGVTKNHQIVFAISKSLLNFHHFASFFRDRLHCDDALYLDGDICAIYLPELGYRPEDSATHFAGMFAVTSRARAQQPR